MSESENEPSCYSSRRNAKKSGGFQSMGLDYGVLKGILHRGYKIPTPIQRKSIPLILDGKDVCAMARTGSGKTAAFLVPMLQKLKTRCPKAGARALLVSPTRELAMQTLKFTKELGKHSNLKICLLVGGENMEEQFASIHENPDIIIATPGRLVHVAVEMNLKLTCVEYVVFDEADRLFEMGFEEQLREIIARLPERRQTLLFSATLPKTLIDFVKAGLNDPILVRLDVDSKISDKLKMSFLFCRFEDKLSALLYLLRHVIDSDREQTMVFCATKHHVEYVAEVLTKLSFKCAHLYSSLDAAARKINIDKFRKNQARILLVTDLAARGVDIPLLDNVINLHFVSKAKLFVHRVGRVARAGRSGQAFSIVSAEEMPYVVDLFMFLGRSLNIVRHGSKYVGQENDAIGKLPSSLIDIEEESIRLIHDGNSDLEFLRQGAVNAYKQYVRTRPTPSRESVERVKKENMTADLAIHPLFDECGVALKTEEAKTSILDGLRNFKPKITVFELNTSNKDQCWLAMKAKRKVHSKFVKSKRDPAAVDTGTSANAETSSSPAASCAGPSNIEIENVFSKIIETKFRDSKTSQSIADKNKVKKAKRLVRDTTTRKDAEYFLPYQPKDFRQENELSLQKSSFEREAESAVVDFTGDETEDMHRRKNQLKWDRKRKVFTREENTGQNKKIKTESGVWVPASYKRDLYSKWLKKSKYGYREEDGEEQDERNNLNRKSGAAKKFANKKVVFPAKTVAGKFKRGKARRVPEIKSNEQILKQRKTKERIQAHQNFRHKKNTKKSGKRNR